MSLAEPGCWAPALPRCVAPSSPLCAGGGEGLQGTKIHELSPLLTDTVQTLRISVLEGTGMHAWLTRRGSRGSASLPCSDALLCKAGSCKVCVQRLLLLLARAERLPMSWPIPRGAQFYPEKTLKMQRGKESWSGCVCGMFNIKARWCARVLVVVCV